jgi:hypothetical protein
LSSILFWGVPTVEAGELSVREAASLSLYCHMQIPDIGTDISVGERPVVDERTGRPNEVYGSCDDDTRQSEEVKIPHQVTLKRYHWAR